MNDFPQSANQSESAHVFGGSWTDSKLEVLRKYLQAYTKIFDRNEKARYFTTYYVDAFAGTGTRVASGSGDDDSSMELFDNSEDMKDAQAFRKGSATIALETEPSFDRYLFIERSEKKAGELEELCKRFSTKQSRCEIRVGDANTRLSEWIQKIDWKKSRAVVFLDPYGMQVDWNLLSGLGKTKAVDLWLLFPVGMGVQRLLTKKGLPPGSWANSLTRLFGTKEWGSEFYTTSRQTNLFGETFDLTEKNCDTQSIQKFMLKRLRSAFDQVCPKTAELKNSRNCVLYSLCFAAANKTASKIARDLISNI